eukprot:2386839-Alexandrium_andersonii.AAC.1
MSASLVGSEMCIRDRPPAVLPRSSTGGVLAPPPPAPASRARRRRSLRESCLLYTSDAADDM